MERSIFAFLGDKLISSGTVSEVTDNTRNLVDRQNILAFDAGNGKQVNINYEQYPPQPAAGPSSEPAGSGPSQVQRRGRPKLGVKGREITLLPRHWEWLDQQRGGASAAIRRLVDEHRASHSDEDRVRQAQDSTNRFLYAIAGNLPAFEEAVRALYAKDTDGFQHCIKAWPQDIRKCAQHYSVNVF